MASFTSSAAPLPSPFLDLTSFVDAEELDALDRYITERVDMSSGKVKLADGDVAPFIAEGGKYSDALELCDRDTSVWCQDVFAAYSGMDDFVQDRAHRADPATWRPNYNGRVLLPGVLDFCARKLPMLSRVGKVAIICNEAGYPGIEHVDHRIDALVSEFVWIRTQSSKKRFYVRDPATGAKCFAGEEAAAAAGGVEQEGEEAAAAAAAASSSSSSRSSSGACVGWFDDHLPHCLEPHGDGPQFSLRVDGRFTPEFRELIASRGRFGSQKVPTEGGLEDVLRAATVEAGPRFLSEENPEPDSDEDDEEENEEEDLEVEVEDEQTKRQLKEKEEAEEGGAGAGGELERGELP